MDGPASAEFSAPMPISEIPGIIIPAPVALPTGIETPEFGEPGEIPEIEIPQ